MAGLALLVLALIAAVAILFVLRAENVPDVDTLEEFRPTDREASVP